MVDVVPNRFENSSWFQSRTAAGELRCRKRPGGMVGVKCGFLGGF